MNRKKSISPGCKEMVLLRGKRILALSIGLLFTIQAGATVDGKLFRLDDALSHDFGRIWRREKAPCDLANSFPA